MINMCKVVSRAWVCHSFLQQATTVFVSCLTGHALKNHSKWCASTPEL